MSTLITGSDPQLVNFYASYLNIMGMTSEVSLSVQDGIRRSLGKTVTHFFLILKNEDDFSVYERLKSMVEEGSKKTFIVIADEELAKIEFSEKLEVITHDNIVGPFADYLAKHHLYKPIYGSDSSTKSKETLINYIKYKLAEGRVNLPVHSEVAIKLIPLLEKDDMTFKEVGEMTKLDPALHAGIIKMANSVYFSGAMGKVMDVQKALVRVGTAKLKVFLLHYLNTSLLGNKNMLFYKKIMESVEAALEVGATCYAVASHFNSSFKVTNPSVVFSIGMLHEIGYIFLLTTLSEYFGNEELDHETKASYIRLARENQIVAGVSLMKRWKFPSLYYTPIENYAEMKENDYMNETRILVFAKYIHKFISNVELDPPDTENEENLSEIKMSAQELIEMKEMIEKHITSLKQILLDTDGEVQIEK